MAIRPMQCSEIGLTACRHRQTMDLFTALGVGFALNSYYFCLVDLLVALKKLGVITHKPMDMKALSFYVF